MNVLEPIARASLRKKGHNVEEEEEEKDNKVDDCDAAHDLLLFVEGIVAYLRDARDRFEKKPGTSCSRLPAGAVLLKSSFNSQLPNPHARILGPRGAEAAIAEWRRFRTPDDKEFEVDYFGPTGNGERGKAVGCKPFFERLNAAGISTDGNKLLEYANQLAGDRADAESEEEKKESSSLDLLVELTSKLSLAISSSE